MKTRILHYVICRLDTDEVALSVTDIEAIVTVCKADMIVFYCQGTYRVLVGGRLDDLKRFSETCRGLVRYRSAIQPATFRLQVSDLPALPGALAVAFLDSQDGLENFEQLRERYAKTDPEPDEKPADL